MSDRIDRDRFLRALEYAKRTGDHSDPVDSDRDFVQEAIDELLDALNYLGWEMKKMKPTDHDFILIDYSVWRIYEEIKMLYKIQEGREGNE